ncbi:hypothetical protein [Nocardioides endophyticus]|uniref:hypothetical protein n=1 Tax=Nocardioides endophyticus TaxID=1353775 RepID=UPI0031EB699A
MATWGLGGSAVANAVTFAVVVGYLALVLRPRYPLPRAEAERVLRGMVCGFGHLRDEPTTRVLVLTLSGLNLAVSPALALGVALRAQGEGGAGADVLMPTAMAGFGALVAAYGVGAACAAYGLAMAVLMLLPQSRPAIRAIGLRPDLELVGSRS